MIMSLPIITFPSLTVPPSYPFLRLSVNFNDIIAQLMNSKKFPFTITESAIFPPPSDSPFKVEIMYGNTNYSHLQFPHDINMKISDYTLLGKYVKFVFKKINADQNSNQVCKEFFLHFWASATVSEFEAQFSVVFFR